MSDTLISARDNLIKSIEYNRNLLGEITKKGHYNRWELVAELNNSIIKMVEKLSDINDKILEASK